LTHTHNGHTWHEEDAYPADPEDGSGWGKHFIERQCRHYFDDYCHEARIVRFHNIYSELGTYEVEGGGEQTRLCCYVADCVEGIQRLVHYRSPLNRGTDRMVTINQLVDLFANIDGKRIRKNWIEAQLEPAGRVAKPA
jgi:GDP-D-mannose 3',5'-epimerase